jgi:hypothetical protein
VSTDEPHLTAVELAAVLRIDPKTVRARVRSGEWPGMVLGPRTIRFSPEDVDQIRRLCTVKPKPVKTRSAARDRRERINNLLGGAA